MRCCAPLDPAMILEASRHQFVVTIEDGIRDGGIGMTIADQVHAIDADIPVQVLGVPTKFIPQGKAERILTSFGLDADGIATTVRSLRADD
jgi:1-deoxy-D-xylulose-5-phosphate synthase